MARGLCMVLRSTAGVGKLWIGDTASDEGLRAVDGEHCS